MIQSERRIEWGKLISIRIDREICGTDVICVISTHSIRVFAIQRKVSTHKTAVVVREKAIKMEKESKTNSCSFPDERSCEYLYKNQFAHINWISSGKLAHIRFNTIRFDLTINLCASCKIFDAPNRIYSCEITRSHAHSMKFILMNTFSFTNQG